MQEPHSQSKTIIMTTILNCWKVISNEEKLALLVLVRKRKICWQEFLAKLSLCRNKQLTFELLAEESLKKGMLPNHEGNCYSGQETGNLVSSHFGKYKTALVDKFLVS
jgi:hypothetical protein